jgi:hypothetical protein
MLSFKHYLTFIQARNYTITYWYQRKDDPLQTGTFEKSFPVSEHTFDIVKQANDVDVKKMKQMTASLKESNPKLNLAQWLDDKW